MKFAITILLASANLVAGRAYRQLAAEMKGHNFFDQFDFYTGGDPTHGHVKYIGREEAQQRGIISAGQDNVYVGVDNSQQQPDGRASVRIESKQRFTRGLFILDLAHMPAGCGIWPAWWTLGDNWPTNGEIDIIEGVNDQTGNLMALHTSQGCVVTGAGQQAEVLTRDCWVNAPGQGNNQGCSSRLGSRPESWGEPFNRNGGGVYAMEWNSQFIKVWFFPRNNIPADVFSATPEPLNWGTPASQFSGPQCDINSHFRENRVIFNITFCGDWAGGVWEPNSTCKARAGGARCNDWVSWNPDQFREAYWIINSLRIYSS